MGSEQGVRTKVFVGPSIVVGTLSSLMALLELLPEEVTTLSGRFPALVQGSISEALALLVCSFFVWGSLVLTLSSDKRGPSSFIVGTMLSVLVGAVISMVGFSTTIVEMSEGARLTPYGLLGSGALTGALLATVSYGTLRPALGKLDRQVRGDTE